MKINVKAFCAFLFGLFAFFLSACSSNFGFTITGMELKDYSSATMVSIPQTATLYALVVSYSGSQTPAIRGGVILIDDVETTNSFFTNYTSDTINVVLEGISEPGKHKITVKLYTQEDSTVREYSKNFTFVTNATSLKITSLELFEYSKTSEEYIDEVENPYSETEYVLRITYSGNATPSLTAENSKIFVDEKESSRSHFLSRNTDDEYVYAMLIAQTEGEHTIAVTLEATENSNVVSEKFSKTFTFSAKS